MDCVKSENYARQRDLASNDKACIKRKYESNKEMKDLLEFMQFRIAKTILAQ